MPASVEQDAFLACCIRHCKEKPQIDFKEVAHELGLSEGGTKYDRHDHISMDAMANNTPLGTSIAP